MTSSNIVDVSRQNGHAEARDKTPEEIQLEIAQTRSAITEDLLALSEKLSPQHLRENAREVMREAREEAKEMLRDAKDAAIGSLRDMKDRAVERVSHGVDVLGGTARQASDATLSFVSANALAMSLVGLGAGLLLITLRGRRRLGRGQPTYTYEHYSYPDAEEILPGEEPSPLQRSAIHPTEEDETHARHGVRHEIDQRAHELAHRAREAARYTAEHTRELARSTAQHTREFARHTREVAGDHRVAAVALTVAAGLGIGLLLPIGRRPRAAMRRAGERMWDGAQRVGHDLGARARGYY